MVNLGEFSKAAREVAKSLDNTDKKEPIKPKLNEDKKKEILEYLDENSKKGNLQLLSKKSVVDSVIDKEFDKSEVESLLKELIAESRIYEDSVSFDIVYPKVYQSSIKDKINRFSDKPFLQYALLGGLIVFFLSIGVDWSQYAVSNTTGLPMTRQELVTYGFAGGVFASIVLGKLIEYILNSMPVLGQNKDMVVILVGLLLSIFLFFNNKELFSFFPTVIVLCNFAFTHFKKKEKG